MAGSAAATICSMWQVLQGFCKKGLSLQEDFEASWGLSSEGFRSESVPGELRARGPASPAAISLPQSWGVLDRVMVGMHPVSCF